MYSTSEIYEFKMSLFDHGNLEEFLLFRLNYNITLMVTGTLDMDMKIQYLCTLVCGEALCQFDLFSADVENIETLNVEYYIKVLALYPPPVNFLTKQKRAIRREIKNAKSESKTLCGALD